MSYKNKERSISSTTTTGKDKFRKRLISQANYELMDAPSRPATDVEIEWLKRAETFALLSDRSKRSRTGCIIVQKNRIISYGWNAWKTHPFQSKWNPHCSHLHAEMAALLNAQKREDFVPHKAVAVVARLSRSGPACSYPCTFCWPCMKHVGLRSIVCYDYDNFPVRIDFPEGDV